jgi:hypothetical protein
MAPCIDLDQWAAGYELTCVKSAVRIGRWPWYPAFRSDDQIRQEAGVEEVLQKKIAEITETFEFFDRDGNGLIDFDEFRSLLQTVNPDATISQSAEGFSITDTNSDGYVDLDEFIEWWRSNWWEY